MSNDTSTRKEVHSENSILAPAEGAAPFPCLNSNISIQPTLLSTQNRKTAFLLSQSVQGLADSVGLERIGFLTLTFGEQIVCPREAQRRLNSLLTNVIKPRYGDYLGVFERQKSGRIHYHLLVVLPFDIRSGVDFEALSQTPPDYRSAGKALRSEWAFWRKTSKLYGFGRSELLPVKSSAEAIGKYVGKYISKHMENRKGEDKGVRLVRYSKGARIGTTRFQFNSAGSAEWRAKLAVFAEIVTYRTGYQVNSISDFSLALEDKKWAHRHRDYIKALPI